MKTIAKLLLLCLVFCGSMALSEIAALTCEWEQECQTTWVPGYPTGGYWCLCSAWIVCDGPVDPIRYEWGSPGECP